MTLLCACLVLATVAAPGSASAQGARRGAQPQATAAAVAAPSTVKGNLRANVVAVRSVADRPLFDYVLSEARVVDGKLELVGTIRPSGRAAGTGDATSATLVGTLSKEPSPEYHAARSRRIAAQRGASQPASGAPADQQQGGPPASAESAGQLGQHAQATQSTARETDPIGPEAEVKAPSAASMRGCEVLFLRVAIPARYAAAAGGRTVQLNVSLARLDNPAGVAISRQICRVVYALGMGEGAGAEVADLNRAIAAARSAP